MIRTMRDLIFGLEDGLVSTMGSVAGVAAGTQDSRVVILSGIVIVVVESLSMSAGSFLSSKTERQMLRKFRQDTSNLPEPKIGALVMLASYILGGLIPLLPYFIAPIRWAIPISIAITIASLFLVGYFKAFATGQNRFKSAAEMVIIASAAGLIGYLTGKLLGMFFGFTPSLGAL